MTKAHETLNPATWEFSSKSGVDRVMHCAPIIRRCTIYESWGRSRCNGNAAPRYEKPRFLATLQEHILVAQIGLGAACQ
jgi:hypothetical protein